jgi:hypothetical protein
VALGGKEQAAMTMEVHESEIRLDAGILVYATLLVLFSLAWVFIPA